MLPRARASRALDAPRLRCGALSAPPLSDHRSSRGIRGILRLAALLCAELHAQSLAAARGASPRRASRPACAASHRALPTWPSRVVARDTAELVVASRATIQPSLGPRRVQVHRRQHQLLQASHRRRHASIAPPARSAPAELLKLQAALSRPLPGGSRSGCFIPPALLRVWPCTRVAPRSWVQREPLPPCCPAVRCACAAAASAARAVSVHPVAGLATSLSPSPLESVCLLIVAAVPAAQPGCSSSDVHPAASGSCPRLLVRSSMFGGCGFVAALFGMNSLPAHARAASSRRRQNDSPCDSSVMCACMLSACACGQRLRTAQRQLREHRLPSQRPGDAIRRCAPREVVGCILLAFESRRRQLIVSAGVSW